MGTNSAVYPAQWPWTPVETKHDKKSNTKLIVVIIVPVFVVVLVGIIIAVMFIHRQRRKVTAALMKTEEGERRVYKIDFSALETSHQLGEGSFGVVYKGEYRGADVAVKKLKQQKVVYFFLFLVLT